MRKIEIKLLGKNNYLRWTLEQWFYEIKDIVEKEYNILLELKVIDTEDAEPMLAIDDAVFLEGLPGEEGYLIEVLKKVLDSVLVSN